MALRVVDRGKSKLVELLSAPASHSCAHPAYPHRILGHNAGTGFFPPDIWRHSLCINGMTRISLASIWQRPEVFLPMEFVQSSRTAHTVSTVRTVQSEISGREAAHKSQLNEQEKKPSMEEFHKAIDNLSKVKSKAIAKQLQKESHRSAETITKRIWKKLLSIGPSMRVTASMNREDWTMKIHHWKAEFKSTLLNYWHGFKLLLVDIRISSKLLIKLVHGKKLSSVERKQLTRTTADIFRLVPFAVCIIVPFMEFLLPVFLKLFPNMLPSTFKGKMKEQEALKWQLKARLEYAKFLQDTIKEMANKGSDPVTMKKTAECLDKFLSKEQKRGEEAEDKVKIKESGIAQDHVALSELTSLTSRVTQELIKAKTLEKQKKLCKISHALAVLASATLLRTERQEFLSLVNKEIELYNEMLEKGVVEGEEVNMAYIAARQKSHHEKEADPADKVSSALRNKVDDLLQKLGEEIDNVDAVLDRREKHLDSDRDGKVTVEEVTAAAMYLKEALDKADIEEVICNLSRDEEGKILIEDIIKLGNGLEVEDIDESKH